eukprot:403363293
MTPGQRQKIVVQCKSSILDPTQPIKVLEVSRENILNSTQDDGNKDQYVISKQNQNEQAYQNNQANRLRQKEILQQLNRNQDLKRQRRDLSYQKYSLIQNNKLMTVAQNSQELTSVDKYISNQQVLMENTLLDQRERNRRKIKQGKNSNSKINQSNQEQSQETQFDLLEETNLNCIMATDIADVMLANEYSTILFPQTVNGYSQSNLVMAESTFIDHNCPNKKSNFQEFTGKRFQENHLDQQCSQQTQIYSRLNLQDQMTCMMDDKDQLDLREFLMEPSRLNYSNDTCSDIEDESNKLLLRNQTKQGKGFSNCPRVTGEEDDNFGCFRKRDQKYLDRKLNNNDEDMGCKRADQESQQNNL